MIWTTEQPTAADAGKWFFIRNKIGQVFIRQVRTQTRMQTNAQQRATGQDKDIYLCPETHDGINKTSYGTPLALYCNERAVEFCGPIQMPPDYKPNSQAGLDN